jgi:hypothetical protein
MHTFEEIAGLRHRLGALEEELAALKHALSALEGRLAAPAAPGETPAPPLAAREPIAPAIAAASIESTPPATSPAVSDLPRAVAQTTAPVTPEHPTPWPVPPTLQPEPIATGPFAAEFARAEAEPDEETVVAASRPACSAARLAEAEVPTAETFAPAPFAPVAPREPTVPWTQMLRGWLEPLQLWPPAGEENAEVRLAAWWATRIGALLAVIGVVFLGVYVSRGAPPWLRLIEVLAVTGGVIGLGHWLERRLPKFGAVVFGAGLALAYFCAFAAYAVPPMKVIASPLLALAAEVAAVAGIFAVAWRRNSPVVATMAVALGYVTAFLALRDERFGFGPWVVLLLGVAAVLLRLTRGWPAPSALAMPLTWVFLAAAAWRHDTGPALGAGAVWFWCALHLVLFTARDWLSAWRGGELDTIDRAMQVTSSSLAVVVGLLAAAQAGGAARWEFFLGSGAAMLGLAAAWRAVRVAPLPPILVCKGTGLIALGVIDALGGQARCLVLLAQAFVMLVSARQSHQRWLNVATTLVAALALGFFLEAMRPAGAAFWTGTTLAEVAFLAGAIGFVAAARRWLDWNDHAAVLGGGLVALVSLATAAHWELHGWTPAIEVALGALLAGVAVALRGAWAASIAGGMLLAAAHAEMWLFSPVRHGRVALWWSEVAVLAGGIAAGVATRGIAAERSRFVLRTVIAALACATWVGVCFRGLTPATALAAALAVPVLLVALATRVRGWPWATLAFPLSLLAGFLFVAKGEGAASPWLWVALAAAWAVPLGLVVSRERWESIAPEAWRSWALAAHAALATSLAVFVLGKNLHGEARVAGFALGAAVLLGWAWRPGLRVALEASWVLWLGAGAAGLLLWPEGGVALWPIALAAWIAAIALTRARALAPLCESSPVRAHAPTVQAWIAAGLTLLAIVENLHGAARIVALVTAAWAAFALAWRPGLRAALETSWALWLATLLTARAVPGGNVFWLLAGAAWLPAVALARLPLPATTAGPWSPWRHARRPIQVALATVLTLLALEKNLAGPVHLLGLALAAVTMLGLAGPLRVRSALEASWCVWVVTLGRSVQLGASGPGWCAGVLSWLGAIGIARLPALSAWRAGQPRWRAHADSVQLVLATLLGVSLALDGATDAVLWALGTIVAAAIATWRFAGLPAARPVAGAVAALAWGWALQALWHGRASGWGTEFAAVVGIAAVVSALPFFVERDLGRSVRTRLRWPAAGAGLALAFALCVLQRGALAPYATVGCGLAAVATFLAGLHVRSRPHRLCGLAGLALCVPRAFVVDLHSTLYRIAAFVALGLVLLWVGFSYHRFRHLIVEDEKKLSSPRPPSA